VVDANVGKADAWIRGALSVVFLVLAAVFSADPLISLVAALLALLLAATGLTRACPLYTLLGVSTSARRSHPQRH
jgi:predicted permease